MQFFMYYGAKEAMVTDSFVADPGREPPPAHKYVNSYPTPSWYAIRDVAPEVQTLARALLNLRPTGSLGFVGNGLLWDQKPPTFPVYNPVVPLRNERFAGLGNLHAVEVMDEDTMGAMIAFFDDKHGQEYFMVINLLHGPNMSKLAGLKTVRLTFSSNVAQIERLNRFTGRVDTLPTRAEGQRRSLDVRLEGGTGDLFKWSNGIAWDMTESCPAGS